MIDLQDFVQEHERALHNFAMHLTKSEDETDDLLQDTWIKCIAHQQILGNMTVQKQRSWLFSVLKNRWLDILRHRKLERMVNSHVEPAPRVNYTPIHLEAHMDKLPPLERDIVHHRFWLGNNSRQISEELGIPEGTVRWRLKMAMDKLRILIEQSDKEERCQL